ncbi:MAG: HtaA domain-containing protein, partial [Nocardioides sp.]|uniref:HtaA domain-containing protein n=1 Tax=Nocardioides sp. TaxID=35761 RepID=UPI003F0B3D27
MKSLKSATGRGIAAGLAGVLVAGAATLLTSAPAQAAAAEGELRWGVSQQFVEHLYFSKMGPVLPTTPTGAVSNGAGHVAGDAATGADDVFTFPAATVTEAGGTTVAEYTGTVRGAFVVGGVEQYQVTISDPVVTSDASGNGSIEATVSASNIAAGPSPAASTTPTRVTVAEFAGGTSTEGTLSATPNWSGVLAPGSQTAVDLGISDPARPVDGKSFAPEFLGALTSGVRAHFYF